MKLKTIRLLLLSMAGEMMVIAVPTLRTHWRRFPFWALALVLSAYIGSRFPDIDQHTDLLIHRSILTHGFLVPLVLFMIALRMKNNLLRDFVLIFMTSIAVHLCFDLFPKAWFGYAQIHIPIYGWTPALVSVIWMCACTVFCLYACVDLIAKGSRGLLFVSGAISIFIYQSFGEREFFLPLITFFFATSGAIWWKLTPRSSKITIVREFIGMTVGTIRGFMKLMEDSYRLARDEYNIATEQRRPFHKYPLRVMARVAQLWLLSLVTATRNVFKTWSVL